MFVGALSCLEIDSEKHNPQWAGSTLSMYFWVVQKKKKDSLISDQIGLKINCSEHETSTIEEKYLLNV